VKSGKEIEAGVVVADGSRREAPFANERIVRFLSELADH
jgi:hypothetical protein